VPSHRDRILDQFTRQAVPFATAPAIRDEAALRLLVEASGAGPDDTVLDVACGPGLVVAAFARAVRHATGIDVTPAMLAQARTLAAEAGLSNVTFREGDVAHLPWADGTFSVSVSRFAFHHFERPGAVLAEMRRVTRPGGRVVVCDLTASDDPAKAAAFHRIEMLRDPSHVRALTLAELEELFAGAGLVGPRITFSRLGFELEGLLERSFPRPEDVQTIRAAYTDSVRDDALGLGTHRVGDQIRAAYSIATLVADAR
jgi:SAM-dependent methyltransferase